MFLKERIISEDDIRDLKQYVEWYFAVCCIIVNFDSMFLVRRRKGKKLANFYKIQNSRINDVLKPMSAHTSNASQEKANTALRVRITIHEPFTVDCCLAVLQLYAAISSGSLASLPAVQMLVGEGGCVWGWVLTSRVDQSVCYWGGKKTGQGKAAKLSSRSPGQHTALGHLSSFE